MQSQQAPIENRFGEAVLDGRRVLGMSQKNLAEILVQRGLMLDASAISRIEKGNRAIRLSEASVIADVVGFSLSDIEHPRDPAEDFARHRKTIDAGLNTAHNGAMELAEAIEEMTWLLDRHPELLETLEDDEELAKPTTTAEYVAWVQERWLKTHWIVKTIGYDFDSDETREAVDSLLHAIVATAVGDGRGE